MLSKHRRGQVRPLTLVRVLDGALNPLDLTTHRMVHYHDGLVMSYLRVVHHLVKSVDGGSRDVLQMHKLEPVLGIRLLQAFL